MLKQAWSLMVVCGPVFVSSEHPACYICLPQLLWLQNMARIVEETTESRERAVEARQSQQQQEIQKRAHLKAVFLKKQLEAMKAAKLKQTGSQKV